MRKSRFEFIAIILRTLPANQTRIMYAIGSSHKCTQDCLSKLITDGMIIRSNEKEAYRGGSTYLYHITDKGMDLLEKLDRVFEVVGEAE